MNVVGPFSTAIAMRWATWYMKSDLIPSNNFPFQTFQPVLDGYRNKCEFTIAEGPDGGRTLVRVISEYMIIQQI